MNCNRLKDTLKIYQPNATCGAFSDPDLNNPTVKRYSMGPLGKSNHCWVLDDNKELSFLLGVMIGIVVMFL